MVFFVPSFVDFDWKKYLILYLPYSQHSFFFLISIVLFVKKYLIRYGTVQAVHMREYIKRYAQFHLGLEYAPFQLFNIQLTHIPTNYMKIGVWPAFWELFDFFESKIDLDYTKILTHLEKL